MKSIKTFVSIILLFAAVHANGQKWRKTDSLKRALQTPPTTQLDVDLLEEIGSDYLFLDNDSAAYYADLGWQLANELGYDKGRFSNAALLCFALMLNGNYASSLGYGVQALDLAETLEDSVMLSQAHQYLSNTHTALENAEEALLHGYLALDYGKTEKLSQELRAIWTGLLGQTYFEFQELDSAIHYLNLSESMYQNWSGLYLLKGKVYFQKREWRNALANYRKGLPIAYQNQVNIDVLALYAQMSIAFDKLAQLDSSLHYAEEALVQESFHSTPTAALLTYGQLVSIYEQTGPADSTIKYLKLESQLNESQLDRDKVKQAQAFIFDQRLREQEEEAKRQLYNEQIQRDILLVIIGAIIVIATLLYRNTVRQKKTNKKLDIAYNRLKNTQSQLIQSEKMASLGELTAGIAHEIQNPLNFVNNFSDVNKELTSELEEALQKGDLEEARAIAKDISANESKIVEHGHRADAIVKGMLQHSRESSGEKEPTDINALADEYLRLSYHGLRAKDKEFNADFTLEDDKSLPKINVVPQEIGRVLLNLINNAFQAVHERKLKEDDFEPKVTVRTRTEGNQIIFEVEDNGAGIPDDVKDKIFQPFYTTKPTGQGTGLGLSLSYDIITKGHGGQLKVETEVGEPTVFIVILPV